MSSQQSPPRVPYIKTASPLPPIRAMSLNPDPLIASFCSTSSYSHTMSPTRSASPTQSARSALSASRLPRTPPVQHLRTPPPTEIQPRKQSIYSSPLSTTRPTRTNSPSDNLSASSYLSASHSSGSSFYSHNRSQCSDGSSGYLLPPQTQPDADNPPYKPRRQSSRSLTMVRKPRRIKADPHKKDRRIKRPRDRRHKCRHKKTKPQQPQDQSHWWLPGCQVSPTAPEGFKELCPDRAGNYIPAKTPRGTTDTFGRILSRNKSRPISSVLTRRWSSVEVGAYKIHLPSILHARSASFIRSPGPITGSSKFPSTNLKGRFRSSTFTRDATDHDVIRTVREKLTLRKLPQETPASITLRRASGASGISETSTLVTGYSGRTIPRAQVPSYLRQRRPSAAYLITSQDIDSITELIEAKRPFDYIQVTPAPRWKKDSVSWTSSHNREQSTHEVIWRGGGSPQSGGPLTDEESPKLLLPTSSEPTPVECSHQRSYGIPGAHPATKDKGDAFDLKNANASINEWSWRSMPKDVPVIITSSDSESNELTPPPGGPWLVEPPKPITSRISVSNEDAASRPQSQHELRNAANSQTKSRPRFSTLAEPFSFPPLPARRTTSDWYSPLPEIDRDPRLQTSRSLYDLGLDMTCRLSAGATRTPTPNGSRKALLGCGDISRVPSVGFNSNYDLQQKKKIMPESRSSSLEAGLERTERRKSSIRIHPKAIARTGESLAVGNSIGASSGERRQSSTKVLQRVRTIDNRHKGERRASGRWRPPSICSPPQIPTLSELEAEDWRSAKTPQQQEQLDKIRTTHSDRIALLKDKGHPLLNADHVGIYGRFTGNVKKNPKEDCVQDCKPHTCDDCEIDPRTPSVDWIE
jgi:hypothetical protein